MSDMSFDDDEFDGDESNVVRDLRKALKAKDKQVKELNSRLEEIETAGRQQTIEGVLAEAGVKPGIGKFIPKEIVTPDEVRAWLGDNAELFGYSKAEDAGEDSDDVKAAARIAKFGDVAQVSDPGDLLSRIAAASNEQELNEALFGNAIGPVG